MHIVLLKFNEKNFAIIYTWYKIWLFSSILKQDLVTADQHIIFIIAAFSDQIETHFRHSSFPNKVDSLF